MLNLGFQDLKTILCIGCHADDIEIGCGGTLLRLLSEQPGVAVYWVVLSATGPREQEAIDSAQAFLHDARASQIVVKDFRDSFFPYQGAAIKEYFRELQSTVSPDVIFTHRREDLHQDHRLIAELTWNTFRQHLILEYEIAKYEGDLGQPNVFVPLSEALCQRKVEGIANSFASQQAKPWFTKETFWSLLRLRGIEAASPTGYAEGLYGRKLTLSPVNVASGTRSLNEATIATH